MQFCACMTRCIEVRLHATFRQNESRFAFEQSDFSRGWSKWRITSANVGSLEEFKAQTVLAGAAQAAGHDLAAGRAEHQSASNVQELFARGSVKLAPKFVSAQQQRHIVRMFKICLANDA
jgi:hypothetical protein